MLTVKETQVSDAGVYECLAINPVGIVTRNFTLLVVGKMFSFELFLSISVNLSVVTSSAQVCLLFGTDENNYRRK